MKSISRPRSSVLVQPGRVLLPKSKRAVAARAMAELDPAECKALMEDADYAYLDVRTPEECSQAAHPASINVPVMFNKGGMQPNPDFMSQVAEKFPAKDAKIVVGCKSGKRAARAIEMMSAEGYTELVNMAGGYDAWKAQGL